MENQVGVERLKKLVELLRQAKREQPDQFNLSMWFSSGAWHFHDSRRIRQQAVDGEIQALHLPCGTSACAGGLACLDPEFRRQGLRLSVPLHGAGTAVPSFNEKSGFEALAEFFGIPIFVSLYFFESHQYREEDRHDPLAVADRIEDHLKEVASCTAND